jgi:hypothetical protein
MADTQLTLTPEQLEYFRALDAAVLAATNQRDAAFTMFIRGHGITSAAVVKMEGAVLTVQTNAD